MNRVLLDTTAVLAHYLDEPGATEVHQLLEDSAQEVMICAVSVAEFARRLSALGESPAVARERALEYAALCDSVVPVDTALAVRGFELAAELSVRVPLIDMFIGAAAHMKDAELIHRDSHFRALSVVKQRELAI